MIRTITESILKKSDLFHREDEKEKSVTEPITFEVFSDYV
jgi:hypothetical protein